MQRLHFLRWLALAIAVLSLQCLESLSDDCTKTLTCGNEPHATLDAQCVWRFPDGGVWATGPHRTPENRWVWPDGRLSESFDCVPQLDGGLLPLGDGGVGGVDGDCNDPNVGCDAPLLCETISGRCVACLASTDCASAADPSLGSLPICDPRIHACVACLRNGDCPESTPQCKTDGSDPARNECVRCLTNQHCQPSETCDPATNECTTRCDGPGQCAPDKVCSSGPTGGAGLCVQCIEDATCPSATPQCNTTTKQCVPCVGVGATTGACNADQVCNAANECVECVSDTQCNTAERPLCDTDRNKCIGCFNSAQCTNPTASRCNTADSVCAACTSDVQCEPDFPICTNGKCVACRDDDQCGGERCNPSTGSCETCLTNAHCSDQDNARCDTTTLECTGCNNSIQCGARFGIRQLCRIERGACVECLTNAQCSDDVRSSRCDDITGLCSPCKADADCLTFEATRACAGGNGNSGRCVECTDNTDCAGRAATPACKVSAGGNSAPVNTCVQCVVDADCPNPAAARCNNNVCVACADDASCAHVTVSGTARPVCDTSVASPVCVQCTGSKRGACGQNVCDSLTKTCSGELANSANLCDECVSDAHCIGGTATGASARRCVQKVFENAPLGYFCFPLSEGTCPVRGFADLTSGTIDSSQESSCLPRLTTCAALDQTGQTCATDPDCGVDNLDDGRCDPALQVCTVPCSLSSDCPGSNQGCFDSICQ